MSRHVMSFRVMSFHVMLSRLNTYTGGQCVSPMTVVAWVTTVLSNVPENRAMSATSNAGPTRGERHTRLRVTFSKHCVWNKCASHDLGVFRLVGNLLRFKDI